jgi:sarcosine/dimethylglycine N-methyltransferase
MYPIRKNHAKRLLKQVGFQDVVSYGDFQEEHRQHGTPDFLVHVASKAYLE